MIEMITTERFKNEIYDYEASKEWTFKSETPIIVNFSATWCGPCHRFAPVLEQISEEYEGQLKVYKIDIDADPAIAVLFEVRSVPSTLFLAPGEDPAISLGGMPIEKMRMAIQDLLGLQPRA